MYRVFCDDALIYDLRDESLILIDPVLDLEVNKAGSFTFKLPPHTPNTIHPEKCYPVFRCCKMMKKYSKVE